MKEEKIKMTQEGYNQQLEALEALKKEFDANEKAMTESYHSSSGDGAHDNGEFESLLNKERVLVSQINNLQKKIQSIEIIEVEDFGENIVNIGDTVLVRMTLSPKEQMEDQITLVGEEGNAVMGKVSINSPLGKSIYKKQVGETVSYKVEKNNIVVDILEKVNVEQKTGGKKL